MKAHDIRYQLFLERNINRLQKHCIITETKDYISAAYLYKYSDSAVGHNGHCSVEEEDDDDDDDDDADDDPLY